MPLEKAAWYDVCERVGMRAESEGGPELWSGNENTVLGDNSVTEWKFVPAQPKSS